MDHIWRFLHHIEQVSNVGTNSCSSHLSFIRFSPAECRLPAVQLRHEATIQEETANVECCLCMEQHFCSTCSLGSSHQIPLTHAYICSCNDRAVCSLGWRNHTSARRDESTKAGLPSHTTIRKFNHDQRMALGDWSQRTASSNYEGLVQLLPRSEHARIFGSLGCICDNCRWWY